MEPQTVRVRIPLAIGAVASVLVLAGLVVALSADAGGGDGADTERIRNPKR
jgi:hypothetical protein